MRLLGDGGGGAGDGQTEEQPACTVMAGFCDCPFACPPRPPPTCPLLPACPLACLPALRTRPPLQAKRPQLRTWLDQFGEVYSKGVIGAAVGLLAVLLLSGVPLLGAAGQVRLRFRVRADGQTQGRVAWRCLPAQGTHLQCPSVSRPARPGCPLCPDGCSIQSSAHHTSLPLLPCLCPAPALQRGAFYRAMGLLTVASPCALVMVPLAYVSAIAATASRCVGCLAWHVSPAASPASPCLAGSAAVVQTFGTVGPAGQLAGWVDGIVSVAAAAAGAFWSRGGGCSMRWRAAALWPLTRREP